MLFSSFLKDSLFLISSWKTGTSRAAYSSQDLDHGKGACDEATQTRMREIILSRPGVMGVDLLNTRLFGNRMFVDVEISADGSQSLESAHHIAEDVHDAIEQNFGIVKHCMVHVNPYAADKDQDTPEDSYSE